MRALSKYTNINTDMDNEPTTIGRTQRTQSRKKRLRAHVDYTSMSVSYGRVKLGVPSGFKEMLETVTREILHEQPRDIPAFLQAYFTCLNEEQQKGSVLNSLVTQRIVEVRDNNDNTETCKESAVTEVQTEAPETSQTDACNATESHTQVDASNSTDNQEQQDACNETVPTSTSDVQVEANEEEIVQKTSHISVNSVSDLPKDFRIVNCEVICKESVEEVNVEAEASEEPKSLEQIEASKSEQQVETEEIIEEEAEEEEKPEEQRKSVWDSQQHFTPEEPEEIEREAPQEASGEQSLEQQDHEHVNYDELANSRPATANEPEEKSQPTETND